MKTLSKSRYLSGRQCELKLWYDCHRRDLATEVTESQQAVFDTGHEVGRLACERLPGGVLVEADHTQAELALEQTRRLLAGDVPAIFEAAFLHDNVLIRADMLERDSNGGWILHEVKSTTKVKDPHLDDVAVQRYVLEGAGVEVSRCGVVTLNNQYVYDGVQLDVDALFAFHDLTADARDIADEVQANVAQFNEIVALADAPLIEPGDQCTSPYECPYLAHCTRDRPMTEYPVGDLPRISSVKRQQLADAGIIDIRDIPDDFALTGNQQRVRQAVLSGREFTSPQLRDALAAVEYPVYYLDFEAANPAIPRHAGTRPYEAFPFQFSIHIEQQDGTLDHIEYLHPDSSDPRPALARELLDALGEQGTICVYSGYEKRSISALADALPEFSADLKKLTERLWDLLKVINSHYYHPEFHGSTSIKKVLPVLVSGMSHADLDIQEGGAAARLYLEAVDSADEAYRQQVFDNLKAYCGLDTLAMVRVKQALAAIAERTPQLKD